VNINCTIHRITNANLFSLKKTFLYQYLNEVKHPNMVVQCSVSENQHQYLRHSSVTPVQSRK